MTESEIFMRIERIMKHSELILEGLNISMGLLNVVCILIICLMYTLSETNKNFQLLNELEILYGINLLLHAIAINNIHFSVTYRELWSQVQQKCSV